MENATKALLIAGGVLLTMLMASLLIYAWGNFSEFYRNQDNIDEIEELAKFNSQFTNFDRKDVHGYDLVSLANKISDYNMRFSDSKGSRNSKNYSPITLKITLGDTVEEIEKKFAYPGINYTHLFKSTTYEQKDTTNKIESIIKEANITEQRYGQGDKTSKLVKAIGSLLAADNQENVRSYASLKNVTEDEAREIMQKEAIAEYEYITGEKPSSYTEMKNKLLGDDSNILRYYEYYQFKKGIFECEGIDYDDQIGRVKSMKFRFTGTIE